MREPDVKGDFLEIAVNDEDQVVINHRDLMADAEGVGHINFSYAQARNLGNLLLEASRQAQLNIRNKAALARMREAESIPVDRSARVLTDGSPVTDDHRELKADGQQKGYVVLSEAERAKGFVRPVRRSYTHQVPGCGAETTMGVALAETYARDPGFYSGTFCCRCSAHFPLDQFVWYGTTEQVGS